MARDWTGRDLNLIKHMLRHGEARLSAQLQLATSADQRATALAGIYVAVATAIMGALAGGTFRGEIVLVASAALTALMFLAAAILCVMATLPVGFCTPGNDPESWYEDVDKGRPEAAVLGEQAEHYNQHILDNRAVIKRNSRYFQVWRAYGYRCADCRIDACRPHLPFGPGLGGIGCGRGGCGCGRGGAC